MSGPDSAEFSAYERILLLIDESPCAEVFRIAIGYFLVPLSSSSSFESTHPALNLAYWFFGVLLALRLVPVVIRQILPFPQRVAAVWVERRQIAKRFDSYQWRKLVWFGIGLSAYALSMRRLDGAGAVLTVLCLIGGVLGALAWRQRSIGPLAGRAGTVAGKAAQEP
jgi:hypothetical protein